MDVFNGEVNVYMNDLFREKCCVSGYHKEFDNVKFFGYMVVFENYFIHSNMYMADVNEKMMRSENADCICIDEKITEGCIRVKQ